jgi:hypothetical protein
LDRKQKEEYGAERNNDPEPNNSRWQETQWPDEVQQAPQNRVKKDNRGLSKTDSGPPLGSLALPLLLNSILSSTHSLRSDFIPST